jgi:nicotinamide mononucleotide transporter
MKFTEFVKNESAGWKKREIIGLIVVIAVILVNSVFLKDNIIAVISALCGIMYTVIAGKGKISCYIFGVCGSGCYSWLAFQNALWGNLILYLCYYIPSQIVGFFSWSRHLKDATHEIIKTQLTRKCKIILFVTGIFGSIITSVILYLLHDSNPVVDGITTFLSVIGMYLTVKRYIEQWIIWLIVNSLSFFMWLNIILGGEKVYSTLVMWTVYVILAVYFYREWKKEIVKE